MHRIIADENISFVKEAFTPFGEVRTMAGRLITRSVLRDASMLLVRSVTRVNRDLLEGTPVRFVASATTGVDHVDVSYLQSRQIGFASAPASNARSVSEYLTASLLSWSRRTQRPLEGIVIGIVGVGNIGTLVFEAAQALGMRCLLNDPPLWRRTAGTGFYSLDHLLAASDVVTVHVPLVTDGPDATEKLIDRHFLGRMKKNALLINMSRGQVMDEAELVRCRSCLGGLVLDVWETEPAVSLDTLAVADQATPHIAGYSFDGKIRATAMIRNAACTFFSVQLPVFTPHDHDTAEDFVIDVSTSKDPVYDAVMTACPVLADDRRMRDIVTVATGERGAFFDALRKGYPRRREFACWRVIGAGNDACRVLKRLGFSVDETAGSPI